HTNRSRQSPRPNERFLGFRVYFLEQRLRGGVNHRFYAPAFNLLKINVRGGRVRWCWRYLMTARTWESLSEINSAVSHVNVIASRPCSDPKAFDTCGYTNSRAAEVESKRPDAYAFAKVKTHGMGVAILLKTGKAVWHVSLNQSSVSSAPLQLSLCQGGLLAGHRPTEFANQFFQMEGMGPF